MPYDDVMYIEELRKWLESFSLISGYNGSNAEDVEHVIDDIIQLWEEAGERLDSGEIAYKLAEKYLKKFDLTPEAQSLILSDIHDYDAFAREPDHLTGALKKEFKGIETALAHLYAQKIDEPVFLMEFDFSNMGGTNLYFLEKLAVARFAEKNDIKNYEDAEAAFDALPHNVRDLQIKEVCQKESFQYTDLAAKIMSQGIINDLERYGGKNAKVTAIRSGGDEMRFLISGVDEETMQRMADNTKYGSEIRMATLGILDHSHAKAPGDKFKNGFGGGFSYIDMRRIENRDTIIEILDEDIKWDKIQDGEIRTGDIHPDSIRKLLNIDLDIDLSELSPQQVDQIFAKTQEYKDMIAERHADLRAYHALAPKKLNEYVSRGQSMLEDINHTPELTISDQNLFDAEGNDLTDDAYATIAERRQAYLESKRYPAYEAANDNRGIPAVLQRFMKFKAETLSPMDPSADVPTSADLARNIDLWHKADPTNPPSFMFVGFHNLGGLNDLLGHDGADLALKEMSQNIVVQSLEEAGICDTDYHISHNGGGEFRLLLKPGLENQIEDAQQKIERATKELNQTSIEVFLENADVDISDELAAKIKNMTFADVQDMKLREATIHGHKRSAYINGLDVVSYHRIVDIDPTATDEKRPWNSGRFLAKAKEFFDSFIDAHRAQCVESIVQRNDAHDPDDKVKHDFIVANEGPVEQSTTTTPSQGLNTKCDQKRDM